MIEDRIIYSAIPTTFLRRIFLYSGKELIGATLFAFCNLYALGPSGLFIFFSAIAFAVWFNYAYIRSQNHLVKIIDNNDEFIFVLQIKNILKTVVISKSAVSTNFVKLKELSPIYMLSVFEGNKRVFDLFSNGKQETETVLLNIDHLIGKSFGDSVNFTQV